MAVTKRKRPANFKFEMPVTEAKKQDIMQNLQSVREVLCRKLGKPVNNTDIMETLLETWKKSNDVCDSDEFKAPGTYTKVRKSQVNQNFFMTSLPSIRKLMDVVSSHGKYCKGILETKKVTKRGHVHSLKLTCTRGDRGKHSYIWASSPYLHNGKYLVNERINHAFLCSGMLPSHYSKFCNAAGIGILSVEKRDTFFKMYKKFVQEEYEDSCNTAILEEVGLYENLDGIDIITDARHGWRKNAQDTSVVAIGERSHKVINCAHVTKADDHVSQRHEKIGTQRIYDDLDSKNISVNIHTHDRNMAINKFVREREHGFTRNQNDLWHGIKSVKKTLTNISSGPRYMEGKTWSEELVDKVEPVATHFYWAVKHCQGNSETLRTMLDDIVYHYQNNHKRCHSSSRCQRDPNYEPSKVVIENPVAIKLLRGAIVNSIIYKHADDFNLGKDTYFVESFNNTLNVYQDKRIAFGSEQYKVRAFLGTLHWNENVSREYTSISLKADPKAPRRLIGKKNYKKKTFNFRNNIWMRYIKFVYSKRAK